MSLWLVSGVARADSEADRCTAAGITVFTNACLTWNGGRLNEAIELFQKGCARPEATATNYYWLGTGEFHCALQRLGMPPSAANREAARRALEAATGALTRAVQMDAGQAESHALLATIYGMQIEENWLRAIRLGPRLQRELKLALGNGTNNARVQYLVGTGQFYLACREASWAAALATLRGAEQLFEAEASTPPSPLEPRWGHDSCLTFIGLCYEKLGRVAEAEKYFHKALALHPEDGLAIAGLTRVAEQKK
jgi:tetratricopeptide (TPR) repeat protein